MKKEEGTRRNERKMKTKYRKIATKKGKKGGKD